MDGIQRKTHTSERGGRKLEWKLIFISFNKWNTNKEFWTETKMTTGHEHEEMVVDTGAILLSMMQKTLPKENSPCRPFMTRKNFSRFMYAEPWHPPCTCDLLSYQKHFTFCKLWLPVFKLQYQICFFNPIIFFFLSFSVCLTCKLALIHCTAKSESEYKFYAHTVDQKLCFYHFYTIISLTFIPI